MTSSEKQALLKDLLNIRLSLHNFRERTLFAHPELRDAFLFNDAEGRLNHDFLVLTSWPIELPPVDYDPDLRT